MRKSQLIPGMFGIFILTVILLASILAPVLAPYEPNAIHMAGTLMPPCASHIMGTDLLGRDIFSRILYGGRSSILLALAATIVSMLAGMTVGTFAGYYGGVFDDIVLIFMNVFQGLPGTSLMIAIAGILGPSFESLMIALVLTSWTGFARIVRTETLRLKEENFIQGLKCLGVSSQGIIWKHIVPNLKGNTMVLFATRIGRSILSISGLSFLGLGIQPPDPDWSVMLNDARMNFRSAPYLIMAPGICLVLLLLGINLVGDMLRDLTDNKTGEAGGY
ncbi:MAG: ABC transporter permease [Lachnospiraceae bacterium]|jgi:peptide/nickel transport system permease protein|nr:ABC transporter permease [Lachnospiraceae bacterium]MCI9135647.1 ABC transporter permease [Lachnospiraceae bacterium]